MSISATPLPPAVNPGSSALRVLQLTDTHLYADEMGALVGIRTDASLTEVIKLAREEFGPWDVVLATGDLVHDSTEAGYARFSRHAQSLGAPVYTLPGNHDEGALLRRYLKAEGVHACARAVVGAWHFVFLDSTVPGEDHGHLAADQLDLLRDALAAEPTRHTLVCLHHQPVPVGSAWLDAMQLDNSAEFLGAIAQAPQVRGVLWGHVHQAFDEMRAGVRFMATPSTCVQFKPNTERFAVDAVPPGYRWLVLHADGGIESGVRRLADMPSSVDLKSLGYR